jgi:hypothetical protein
MRWLGSRAGSRVDPGIPKHLSRPSYTVAPVAFSKRVVTCAASPAGPSESLEPLRRYGRYFQRFHRRRHCFSHCYRRHCNRHAIDLLSWACGTNVLVWRRFVMLRMRVSRPKVN